MENTTQTGQNSKQHAAYKRRVCFYAHILSMLSIQIAVLPNLKKKHSKIVLVILV